MALPHARNSRRALAAALVAGAAALPAAAAAAPTSPFTDRPIVSCPGPAPTLAVAAAVRGSRITGAFQVSLTARGLTVSSGSRLLWSSQPGAPFVGAFAGSDPVTSLGGFSFVHASAARCWRAQRVTGLVQDGARITVSGTLGRGARFTVSFAPRTADRLGMTVHVAAPGASGVLLTAGSPRREAVHGFGAQTRFDLKGGIVPVITREQGVGRGEPVITAAQDALTPPQGGSYDTTYAVVPEYVTSSDRGFFWEGTRYGVFDLRGRNRIAMQLWSTTMRAQILDGSTPARLVSAYAGYAGHMRPLPAWVGRGAIVGLQGGTATVLARVAALRAAHVPLAGVWLQDWVGPRQTSFGSRLLWNWTLNRTQYPGWSQMVATLRREGIRVLTYINPMLASDGVPAGERDLYAEAAARGYLVRTRQGGPYLLPQGGFSAGLIDLSNPAARRWTVGILHDMARRFGASGWMADFGEQAPIDGVYDHGTGAVWHNRYPAAWAQVQAQATRGTDVVPFYRSAAATSPRFARLFWMGDQNVDFSAQDGMRSALTGTLSAGLSGFALNHSDTGGYTTLAAPALTRSPQLLERWSEMNAFSGAMLRTHEGNRPTLNAQVYSTPQTARGFAVWARVFAALAPYRQSVERQAFATGLPIARPLWLTWPRLGAVTREFTLGSQLLVAPVFAPGPAQVRVTLPPGRWFDVWRGRALEGGRTLTVSAPGDRLPVYARSRSLARVIARAARR